MSGPHSNRLNIDNRYRRQCQRFRLVMFYALLLAPWIGIGAFGALQPTVNSPLTWVDSDFAPRRAYDRFGSLFGAGDAVIISWPGCAIDDPSVDRFVGSLRRSTGFRQDGKWLFRRVLSGREAYLSLTRSPIGMDSARALERLSGTMIGPDAKTTCVVIFFNELGLEQRSRLVPLIRTAAHRFGKAELETIHMAGPIMDGYAVDRSSHLAMKRFAPLSSIVAFCVCVLCLESLYTASLVFGLACLGQAVALSVIYHSGGSMTALLIVIPPLVQVLAISGGIHFVNYYRAASMRLGPIDGIAEALRLGAVPCVLSAATTAIGLGSLSVSGLSVVREFGFYAAVGVLSNVVLLLSFLPGMLALPHRWSSPKSSGSGASDAAFTSSLSPVSQGRYLPVWDLLRRIQVRFGTAISALAVAVMFGLGWGTRKLEASVRIETLFAEENQLITDYRWIEEHVGATVPIETVVHFDPGTRLGALDRIKILRDVEQRLAGTSSVRAVTSCLGFLPTRFEAIQETLAPLILDQIKPQLNDVDYFAQDEDGEHWRLTAYLSAIEPIHYGDVLDELNDSFSPIDRGQQDGPDVHVEVSGLMPLVHGIQAQLLRDLSASFVAAFLLIWLVMTIAEAGILAGFVSMIPNVFPSVTLFGMLGWLGWSIDIGSIMTASVAMGIAVDDTLHFLSVFRHHVDEGKSRDEAVFFAYGECGRAMIQTTLICASGMAIFALSDFLPTARFAWMMVALLSMALIGDLIVLPALLVSPAGKLFEMSHSTAEQPKPQSRVIAGRPHLPSTAIKQPYRSARGRRYLDPGPRK